MSFAPGVDDEMVEAYLVAEVDRLTARAIASDERRAQRTVRALNAGKLIRTRAEYLPTRVRPLLRKLHWGETCELLDALHGSGPSLFTLAKHGSPTLRQIARLLLEQPAAQAVVRALLQRARSAPSHDLALDQADPVVQEPALRTLRSTGPPAVPSHVPVAGSRAVA